MNAIGTMSNVEALQYELGAVEVEVLVVVEMVGSSRYWEHNRMSAFSELKRYAFNRFVKILEKELFKKNALFFIGRCSSEIK